MILPLHVNELVIEIGNASIHVPHRVSQLLIITLNMAQSVQFYLAILQVTRPPIILLLLLCAVMQLLPQALHVFFESGRLNPLMVRLVISISLVPLGLVHNLQVVVPLLRSLSLQTSPLVLELSLQQIPLLVYSVSQLAVKVLPPELLLCGHPLILLVNPGLHFLFHDLFTLDHFELHPVMVFINRILGLPFFGIKLLIVPIILDPLGMLELNLHLVSDFLQVLLVLKAHLLLK